MSDTCETLLLKNQLCFPLYATAKALVRKYEPFLEPLGLTYTQYIVMLVLWEKDHVTVNEVGEAVCLDSGTLSPLLKKLEAKGYLEKDKAKDSRFRILSLTPEGVALKEKAKEIPAKVGSCLGLSLQEAQQLYVLCYKALGNLS